MSSDEPLAIYVKTPAERKHYLLSYDDWLDIGETLVSVTFEGNGLVVDGWLIEPSLQKSVTYFVSGGDDGVTYEVVVTATTSNGQIKENCLLFAVNDC